MSEPILLSDDTILLQKRQIDSTDEQRARFREVSAFHGLFARIARQLNLERSHVRRVAIGERTSHRVERALSEALEKIERRAT